MQIQLSFEMLRVVEQAAIASARTMGTGDRHKPIKPPWKPCASDGQRSHGRHDRDRRRRA